MAKDKLSHLYRYNVTQTEILGKDYTDRDLRGRACVWQPGSGIFLPSDADADVAIPFGVIQRVFVTGKDPEKPLQEYQTKGRTVTVLQHGIMPDFLAQDEVKVGELVYPYGITQFTMGNAGSSPEDRGMWFPDPNVLLPVSTGQVSRAFVDTFLRWPFITQAYTAALAEQRFLAYIR